MLPVIDLGPFAIQAPGLFLILSLWMGVWLMGKFSKSLGTNGEAIENSLTIGVITGIIGARIGFLLQQPTIFLQNPLSLFSLTLSMMNASFGLLVGLLAVFITAQKKHLPLWPSLDTAAPLFILGFIGWHLANFASGDAYGLPTSLPWGVELWNAFRHPVQLYALILTLGFCIGFAIRTKGLKETGFLRSGILTQWVIASLAFIMLITQAFVQEKTLIAGVDLIQGVSFLILLGCFALIYKRRYTPRKWITALISLGSNTDPMKNLSKAVEALQDSFNIQKQSSILQSHDVTKHSDAPTFYNQVIEITTDDSYPNLRKTMKSIEYDFGRQQGDKQHVPLDLDILTYDEDVFIHDGNRIPHPNLIRNHYIVGPLVEISPDFRHPATGQSIQEISLEIEDDHSDVKKNKR